MREVHRSQFQLGQVPVEKVWINPKSRDDIPAVLKGLQHIWCDEALRARLLALLDKHIVPEADRTVGRPGMDLWQILVLGVLKQGLGCDFDRLHDLTNHHETIRAFLGHGDFDDKTRYEYKTVVDNVSLLTPELLSGVGRLVVESGHKVAKKSLASHYAGGVTRSLSRRTCIIRRTSACCGTRCVACCGRRGGRLSIARCAAGVSGTICRGRSRNCSTGCARRGERSGMRSGWRPMWRAAGRWWSAHSLLHQRDAVDPGKYPDPAGPARACACCRARGTDRNWTRVDRKMLWSTAASSSQQRARVLTDVKARRFAPPPLRGADGLDAGSAHARPDWLLPTMLTHTPPTGCGRRPVQNDALSGDR